MSFRTLEHVLAGARDRGLPFITYADLAAGAEGSGLALSFDDTGVAEWFSARALFQAYDVRSTFFVTRYHQISDDNRALLRQLAADGHDIAAHTVLHLRAPDYVDEHGLAAYLADEVLPSIEILRAEGYPITSFAYPFGARTDQLDRVLLRYVPILRSVEFPYEGVFSPCPR